MVCLLLSTGIAYLVLTLGLAEWLALTDHQRWFEYVINANSIVILTFFTGNVVNVLNVVSARSSEAEPMEWLPWTVAVCTGIVVSLLNWLWLPVYVGFGFMIPLLFLPLLLYRVMPVEEAAKPRLFSMEETCKAQDTVYMSKLIRDFRERYPKSRAYMYKSPENHTAGGILLHSKEAIPEMDGSFIEVTLKCPFTTKSGVFAEGREVFYAYLSRHLPSGTIVSALPQKNWQLWLEGLTDSEWYDRIEALNDMEPNYPCLEDYPCQLTDITIQFEPFEWT